MTFDYSNNNGRFVIGEGHFLFETEWGKASDRAIRVYNDPASIDGLALAKVDQMSEIVDATTLDFSSRHRLPHIGQVVVWRNQNGIYAATKVVGIKDDTRGADHDEVTFEFRILTEGASFA